MNGAAGGRTSGVRSPVLIADYDLLTLGIAPKGFKDASNQSRAPYRLLGKLNTVPSRTPAEGQRWVMVLRLV